LKFLSDPKLESRKKISIFRCEEGESEGGRHTFKLDLHSTAKGGEKLACAWE